MERFDSVKEFAKVYKVPLIFGGAGLVFLIIGVILAWIPSRISPHAFVVSTHSSEATISGVLVKTIVIDLGGAVASPGVYMLDEGSRVADAITKAGGLRKDANTDWVAKNLNQAQKLVDGTKLYIPTVNENLSDKTQMSTGNQSINTKININTASASELDTLYGVGEKTVEKIIAGRPYATIEELVSKKIISQSAFEKMKDKITVVGN